MFPVSKANFLARKKTGFLSHSGHKIAAAFVSGFGWGGLGCGGIANRDVLEGIKAEAHGDSSACDS